ncbi:MAG: mobilization protein BmpH, partial [Tannerella sp.]|nr:mobilization protein BmpH [Tannerella sp.]
MRSIFPMMKEQVRIADLCQKIGFTVDAVRRLLKGVVLTVNGKLYSPEHRQHFEAKDLKAQIEKEPD